MRAFWTAVALSVLLWAILPSQGSNTRAVPEKKYGFRVVRNVPYVRGKRAAGRRHWLDLYLPKGKKDAPVLFFVHGGAWVHGDKDHLGIYRRMGRAFARKGIAVVVINYRLSPEVKHPEHVRDVARAFAWVKKNIAKHGGDPENVFLMGHSAGGHLVSLLALNERYLKERKLSSDAVRGVITMSGVYEIGPLRLYDPIFGREAKVRRDASPLAHVKAKSHLPFLIVTAEHEMPGLNRQARRLRKKLERNDHPVKFLEVQGRAHATLLLAMGSEDEPATAAILEFVAKQVKRPDEKASKDP